MPQRYGGAQFDKILNCLHIPAHQRAPPTLRRVNLLFATADGQR
jgi:hypothetical protein